MLVRERYRRRPLGIVALVLFVALYVAELVNPAWLPHLNERLTLLAIGQVTQTKTTFLNVINILSNSTMALIYTAILMVVLWAMRWKIPALWVGLTVILGLVLAWVLRWGARMITGDIQYGTSYSFPGLHVLGMVLLLEIVYAIFLPYFRDRALAILVGFVLLVWLLATVEACIYFGANKPMDAVGALLLGFFWVAFVSIVYRSVAHRLQRIPLLKDSNF